MSLHKLSGSLLRLYKWLVDKLFTLEIYLKKIGFPLLVLFALLYYGAYFNAGLTMNGEAGSNVLIAIRIKEGWLPVKDMFIGYNLMWFYPLTWIFSLTGPHLLATQIYFMILSALSGMLGYFLLRKATGWVWLALTCGILMLLMPGAIFRNYMGFIGSLSSFCLVKAYVLDAGSMRRQCFWMGLAGAAISLCYLIRIEPSLLITVVWAGLVLLYPFSSRGDFFKRLRTVLIGTACGGLAFVAVHTPFLLHADQRGFGNEFRAQYKNFINLMSHELFREVSITQKNATLKASKSRSEEVSAHLPAITQASSTAQPSTVTPGTDGRRARPSLYDAISGKTAFYFTLSIYFPILSAGLMSLFGFGLLLHSLMMQNELFKKLALLVLTTTGCALSLFPQYYFFRPDSVHLAEFMVPFYPALACASFAATRVFQNSKLLRVPALLIILICLLQVFVAFNSLFGREGSGSIRQARGRTAYFHALNGVNFRVSPNELSQWEGIRDAILKNSKSGDYVVTYPYVALLNVLSDRPSYQRKLYADNATETLAFSQRAIQELDKNKPAVVVVNNRDINKNEISRFKNWAAPFYNYLKSQYSLEGVYFGQVEVFVRRSQSISPLP
jgi:hypothetical protein